jgi:hypothetical protein
MIQWRKRRRRESESRRRDAGFRRGENLEKAGKCQRHVVERPEKVVRWKSWKE